VIGVIFTEHAIAILRSNDVDRLMQKIYSDNGEEDKEVLMALSGEFDSIFRLELENNMLKLDLFTAYPEFIKEILDIFSRDLDVTLLEWKIIPLATPMTERNLKDYLREHTDDSMLLEELFKESLKDILSRKPDEFGDNFQIEIEFFTDEEDEDEDDDDDETQNT